MEDPVNVYETDYIHATKLVIHCGTLKPTRATLPSTGKKIGAYSAPAVALDFDLRSDASLLPIPLLTTKDMRKSFDKIVHELLWFISGSTNVKDLQKNDVHIWDAWANKKGELGPVYGAAWRRYEGKGGTVDQLAQVIEGIREVRANPEASIGRRLIVNAWDPTRISEMGLPPCHCMFQFLVYGDRLHLVLTQRSGDVFLGIPFNMTSYSLLLHMVARVTGLKAGTFHHRINDFHVYENHVEQIKEQWNRRPFDTPHVLIARRKEIDDFKFEDFELFDYQCHGPLRGEVAV